MAEKPPPFCSSRHYSGMFTPDGDNNFTPCVCPARAICHLRTQSCCHSTRPPEWRPRQSAPGPPLASLACSFLILEHSYSGCNFFFNRIWKFIKNFVLGHSIQLVDLISHPGDESLPQALGGQSPKQWTARDIHRDRFLIVSSPSMSLSPFSFQEKYMGSIYSFWSFGIPWWSKSLKQLRLCCPWQGLWVQLLVRELRSLCLMPLKH